MKIIFTVLDGLGDHPIDAFSGKTPLEKADTPNMDSLASEGICGVLDPVFTKALPTSEEGHFALFGYDPNNYRIQRGLFTSIGSGLEMEKGDVALRGNFGTVDEEMNVVDRRAGRIKNPEPLIDALNGIEIDGVKFYLKSAKEHRVGILMKGPGLSGQISDGDAHYEKLIKAIQEIRPLDNTKEAEFTAEVLNKFLEKTHNILKDHPLNKERKEKGLPVANYILTRGASELQNLPTFKERYGLSACCIAGKVLYKQIGEVLGMDLIKVKGANGLSTTNLKGKIEAAISCIKEHDFVFLHIKATDSLAEDGNYLEKKDFIEKVDKNIKPFLDLKDTLIVITADHSTCCDLKRHCDAKIPVLIFGNGKDDVSSFSEKECTNGGLGEIKQTELINKVINLVKQ